MDRPHLQYVRNLPRVPTLDAPPALLAVAVVHHELGDVRPHLRQIQHVLVARPVQPYPPVAMPAPQGAAHPDRVVHPPGTLRQGLAPVSLTRLAAGSLRIQGWRALRERGRLPLPTPPQLLDDSLEFRDALVLGRQLAVPPGQFPFQPSDPVQQLLDRGRIPRHAPIQPHSSAT